MDEGMRRQFQPSGGSNSFVDGRTLIAMVRRLDNSNFAPAATIAAELLA
jgi:hypothetical protein